jgi:hypothetical protein
LVIGIFRNRLREGAAGYPATASPSKALPREAWRDDPEHRVD